MRYVSSTLPLALFSAFLLLAWPDPASAQGILSAGTNRVSTVAIFAKNAAYGIFVIAMVVQCIWRLFFRYGSGMGQWWSFFLQLVGGCFLIVMSEQLFSFLQTGQG